MGILNDLYEEKHCIKKGDKIKLHPVYHNTDWDGILEVNRIINSETQITIPRLDIRVKPKNAEKIAVLLTNKDNLTQSFNASKWDFIKQKK